MSTVRVAELHIDPEFDAIGRRLSVEEETLLTASLRESGCIDPIVTWKDHDDTILDGHNRYRKCSALGIQFRTHAIELEDRLAARKWIIDHQLGKRNLTDEEKAYYRGLRYLEEKKPHGKRGPEKTDQNDQSSGTADRLAERELVSAPTIRRDAVFAKSVDALAAEEPEIKQEILSGQSGLTKQAIVEVAAAPQPERLAAYEKAKSAVHVSHNTGMPEWYTPTEYIEAARKILGCIDLDPASSEVAQKNVKAKKFFTVEDDGLLHDWKGCVWMNPPYTAGLVDRFIEKLVNHVEVGDVESAVVLVNNATETRWFQRASECASALCLPSGRIRFLDTEGNPKGAPLQGQAFLYFGDEPETFAEIFSAFGICWSRWR